MENGEIKIYFILMICWIIVFVAIWLIIRKKYPNLIGVGKQKNSQKIDGVKFQSCNKCRIGVLEPKFKWWQYMFMFFLPNGTIYVFGKPQYYCCNNCFHINHSTPNSFFTRISFTHKIDRAFLLGLLIQIIIGLFLILIFWEITS